MTFNFCHKKKASFVIIVGLYFLYSPGLINAQTELTIENQTYTNSDETWLGVNVPRSEPTRFIFRNNTITSSNLYGYQLQAGDEVTNEYNNNLDGALITGNKIIWQGTNMQIITHSIFTGHNSNVVIKYNYLDHAPMGIIRKSTSNMSNTGGGIAYNIVKGGAVAVVVKGMSNVNVFNNTFYSDRTTSQTWRPLLHIYTNVDDGGYSVAHGTQIFNNIFYTKYQTYAITIDDNESLNGLKCDYNVYWCETGTPRFVVNGQVLSFTQWQALGFDLHSHVFNPEFKDLINFVPGSRLDLGISLGQEWDAGLSTTAQWGSGDPQLATQDETWQVGAVLYGEHINNQKNEIYVTPNPARNYLTIYNLDLTLGSHTIRLYDLAGKLRYETQIGQGDNNQIYFDLESGIFIIQILFNGSKKFAERIIVIK